MAAREFVTVAAGHSNLTAGLLPLNDVLEDVVQHELEALSISFDSRWQNRVIIARFLAD